MQTLIEHFESGGEKLDQSIRGLTAEDLAIQPPRDMIPEIGAWTVQQILIHMQDSELMYFGRMQRVIATDNPPLQAYDENKFASGLCYDMQSAIEAIKLVDGSRKQMARILRQLPDPAWKRTGTHSERGVLSLEQLVDGAVKHLEHHITFIHKKRAWMGKEMW